VPVDLDKFRNTKTLRWQPHTVFEPGKGADGTLFTGEGAGMPLDIYSPEEMTRDVHPPISGGVGIVEYKPVAVADAQAAIRGWCREQLGRDDVVFEPWGDNR
jgi:hypothetical protein